MSFDDIPKHEYKEGESFRAIVPFGRESMKVHICYVLPSKCYSDDTLLIYKVYGKHKQWWHELMCRTDQMDMYRHFYDKRENTKAS
ncbi:hypothetical protein DRO66_00375 [Candidatus Bathyarchaeota archaeon]|nr:MAG: hypothetical protein DRO66_00375 [Candidatus Bathyarchaeota archaeon]